jgi:hypothetical protein
MYRSNYVQALDKTGTAHPQENEMSLVSLNGREPLAYSVADFCDMTGTKPAGIWNAIKRGEIQVARFGRRTLIPHKAAVEWLDRLTAKSNG